MKIYWRIVSLNQFFFQNIPLNSMTVSLELVQQ